MKVPKSGVDFFRKVCNNWCYHSCIFPPCSAIILSNFYGISYVHDSRNKEAGWKIRTVQKAGYTVPFLFYTSHFMIFGKLSIAKFCFVWYCQYFIFYLCMMHNSSHFHWFLFLPDAILFSQQDRILYLLKSVRCIQSIHIIVLFIFICIVSPLYAGSADSFLYYLQIYVHDSNRYVFVLMLEYRKSNVPVIVTEKQFPF